MVVIFRTKAAPSRLVPPPCSSVSHLATRTPKEQSDRVPPHRLQSLDPAAGPCLPPAAPHTQLPAPSCCEGNSKPVSACAIHSTQRLSDSHTSSALASPVRGCPPDIPQVPPLSSDHLRALCDPVTAQTTRWGSPCLQVLVPLLAAALQRQDQGWPLPVFGGRWLRSCPGEGFGKWHSCHMSHTKGHRF